MSQFYQRHYCQNWFIVFTCSLNFKNHDTVFRVMWHCNEYPSNVGRFPHPVPTVTRIFPLLSRSFTFPHTLTTFIKMNLNRDRMASSLYEELATQPQKTNPWKYGKKSLKIWRNFSTVILCGSLPLPYYHVPLFQLFYCMFCSSVCYIFLHHPNSTGRVPNAVQSTGFFLRHPTVPTRLTRIHNVFNCAPLLATKK